MRHPIVVALLLSLFAHPCFAQVEPPSIVPQPVFMKVDTGSLAFTCFGPTAADTALLRIIETDVMPLLPPVECFFALPMDFTIVKPDTIVPAETYWLRIAMDGIHISATSNAGLYRASRTLMQLIEHARAGQRLPCLSIVDYPRFPWRGMHLDVCRHFFPVPFVKEYIDLLARYKMNTFHWHLSDDQGWRIEIKKYPKLTRVGAQRGGSQFGPYSRREYDSVPYGGFYTQEQIREVVAYAAARSINVVPEIEMPGHALAALTAYPELGCTGGPYEVQKGWGVFPDVFCTKDSTIAFLENVLNEVMDLFPSHYIHIGGDECPHERWKACPRCQAVMQREGLKNDGELQSYFIRKIEHYVNGRGRSIIGWDEILEGGLAPNATVMSWRGTEGGIAAAKSGHYAVMTPGEVCYFDHYQGDPANEPLAIGGYTPLQKVYGYEPVPAELKPEQAKHILGAQGNLWTEYITTENQAEYMALPRMAALAEVLWSPKEKRSEADFIARLEREFPALEERQVNVSKSLYTVAVELSGSKKREQVNIDLSSGGTVGDILFTLDSSEPIASSPPFVSTIELRDTATLRTALFRDGRKIGNTISRSFHFNKATGRAITCQPAPEERYSNGGPFTLVDGITAQEKRVNTEWLGWRNSVTITLDLGSVQDIGHVGIGALNETYGWIHLPKVVEFSTSTDGKTFAPLGIGLASGTLTKMHSDMGRPTSSFAYASGRNAYTVDKRAKARYVRFVVQHSGNIPEGYPGAGSPAWLFLDEIEVR